MTAHADPASTAELLDGRYLLGDCVGRGGMAQVFRAEDVVLGRTVAIKIMRGEADGASVPPRARTEMALLASLNHPSLVTLFDAHVVPGKPEYLVMEYVEGATLADELAKGPMDAAEVAALATELASALHVVHDAGIVHRDVKPSNVLLASDPLPGRRHRAKLADFGVAYLAEGDRLTSPGVVIGTAAYLAPEQVRGEAATPASDIYALGLLLLEALTGGRAFPQASGIGAVMARLVESPEAPAWLGWEWVTLLQAMTASEPARRPTALDVVRAVSTLPTDIVRPTAAPQPASPPLPPLPTTPAAVAALQEPTLAMTAAAAMTTAATPDAAGTAAADAPTAAAHAVRRRHRRAQPGSRRARATRTRTTLLIGSALAVAAILGTNAATWVGGTPSTPSLVVPTEGDPTTPAEADTAGDTVADEEPLVVTVTEEEPDTGQNTTPSTAGEPKAKGGDKAKAKGADKKAKGAEKAKPKGADKAKPKGAKDAEKRKADRDAEKAHREAKKDAEKNAREAAREQRKREREARTPGPGADGDRPAEYSASSSAGTTLLAAV